MATLARSLWAPDHLEKLGRADLCRGDSSGQAPELPLTLKRVRAADPERVDVDLTQGMGEFAPAAADATLYNVSSPSGDDATGECDLRGTCTITFTSGLRCNGEYVRENQGTTRTIAGADSRSGYVYSGLMGAAAGSSGAMAATGREIPNSQRGVTMFRCQDRIIDCSMTMDSNGPGGYGDCKDGHGVKYRLMLKPK